MTAGTSTNSTTGLRDNRLYRSADNSMIAGVCAGLARYFGIDVTLTRVIVAVAAFFFPILIVAYIVLALVLPKQSTRRAGQDAGFDDELSERVRTAPHATLDSVRHRFRDLERRLQRLEKHVTSKRYNLEREFDNLKD